MRSPAAVPRRADLSADGDRGPDGKLRILCERNRKQIIFES